MAHDDDGIEPTGYTGDRDRAPTIDLMADYLQTWDAVTDHPRDWGDYMVLASALLALDEEPPPST